MSANEAYVTQVLALQGAAVAPAAALAIAATVSTQLAAAAAAYAALPFEAEPPNFLVVLAAERA